MTNPAIGDRVDDLTLLRPDGTAIRLAEAVAATTLLIFLRHLA